MPRIHWKATLTSADVRPIITTATNSIAAIQRDLGALQPYNAGAQSAFTTVSWPPAAPRVSATAAQEHSEMVALGRTLAPPAIWQMNAGGSVVAHNELGIGGANYRTNLPHCGYCTIMLHVLGLPIGVATAGRYNLAVNLDYTVPLPVFENFNLLARLVNSNAAGNAGWVVIKRIINAFIQHPSTDWVLQVGEVFVTDTAVVNQSGNATVLNWTEAKEHNVNVDEQHFMQNTLLRTLWKFVYRGMYNKCN